MTNKSTDLPLTEKEKQTKPLLGETSPEEASVKARTFAGQERSKLKNRK